MQACTSVVTKISYHKRKVIQADVSFVSLEEWKRELAIVLRDLADDTGGTKIADSDAAVAWGKVHAVYPTLSVDELVEMDVQQILDSNLDIAKRLGTTETIIAIDSTAFGKEIAKYIDSSTKGNDNEDDVALWPLIREVHIKYRAKALSTGAVLVDLPGVADANAARDSIAQKHLKEANRIWILADITRAVDNKTAKDLLGESFRRQLLSNYDDQCITFIAGKTDDVASSEIARALNLEGDKEYRELESRIAAIEKQLKELEDEKKEVVRLIQPLGKRIQELQRRQKALVEGDGSVCLQYPPEAAIWGSHAGEKDKKRKCEKRNTNKPGPSKVPRKNINENVGANMWTTLDDDSEGDASSDSGDELDTLHEDAACSDIDVDDEFSEIEDTFDQKTMKETLRKIEVELAQLRPERDRLNERGQAMLLEGASLTEKLAVEQKKKDMFCSLARNKDSKEKLKADFRAGLKCMDDMVEEQQNPTGFDPTQQLRDYQFVDLPVFTCSSRDYMRLSGQLKGDGEASCFSNKHDTEIPALQKWCHQLTLPARERAAKAFLHKLRNLAQNVKVYIERIQNGQIAGVNRSALRLKWESSVAPEGVARRLSREFSVLSNKCILDLQQCFRDGLEEKCKAGVELAVNSALETVDQFGKMHHSTYRATIRRDGSFKRDLNIELVDPFTKSIAYSFSAMFEKDIFGPFEVSIVNAIAKLLEDFQKTIAEELLSGARHQGKACHKEARTVLQNTMEAVKETVSSQRKEISRSIAPVVQNRLRTTYDLAKAEKGPGSMARQKGHIRSFVERNKDTMFQEAADTIMTALDNAAVAVGQTLGQTLATLAAKVEISLAVLWEEVHDSASEQAARNHTLALVSQIHDRVSLYIEAARLKEEGDDPLKFESEDIGLHPFR
ncbi:hypothetical protein DFP72DRAFT_873491 [Ephemerocybe angulata]|uniref:DUF7605 domain-containing protein n=1 Tax=Ephemerocybe angulata TaxID=980116 RepID=A0A8H6MFU4_9AGAR|nr:hypothetical protein DFP72DRAFT_873491 [Tulosesus angulatus]